VVSRTSGQTTQVASPHILTGHILTVGLGAVASGWALGPVQLHHLLAAGAQEAGQAGAVAAGTLDRPQPAAAVAVGQRQELLVAGRGGRHGRDLDHRASGRGHHRGGVGVLVGVDPDGRARRGLPGWPCVDSLPGATWTGPVRAGRTAGL